MVEDRAFERIREAFAPVQPAWTSVRAEAALAEVHGRLHRRARRRKIGAASAALLLLVGVGLFLGRSRGPELARLQLDDGSIVRPLSPTTVIEPIEMSARLRHVRLHGPAEFDVTSAPARPFRVEAGGVTVEVLGTSFTLEPQAGRTRVAVAHGRVRVSWRDGDRVLGAGEAGLFPPDRAPAAAVEPPAEEPPAPQKPAIDPRPAPRPWRTLAQQGRFHDAYRALPQKPNARAHELAAATGPDALMLAADVARFSGHPAEALPPLRLFLQRHARDPRSSLAAFTLGRILLDQLGRPREAAAAFARSLQLDPRGDLAEDALARESESWSKAGDAVRASDKAREYLRLYPEGRRANAVRSYGTLP